MAGDHKCPVCNSTFTRPQHVARHMRSHTGDRPYKCQHCGDQFARSDLLSRHINKCHASEKPPTTTAPNNRRKGTAAASRATTSKQACDQCVQSSLPCDGCNPCSKCVSRKCRCTYVKFHRQTAPAGPGHPPPNALPHQPHRGGAYVTGGYPEEYMLAGPAAPSSMNGMYMPADYSLPPPSSLYPTHQVYADPRDPALVMSRETLDNSPEMIARYRAQAELLGRAGVMPNGALAMNPTHTHVVSEMYAADHQQLGRYDMSSSQAQAWAHAGHGHSFQDGGQHAKPVDGFPPGSERPFSGGGGSAALSAHPPPHGAPFSQLSAAAVQQGAAAAGAYAGGGIPFPQQHVQHPGHARPDGHRRSEELSDDFGSDTHSVPSSANSSSVHLPLVDPHGRPYSASPTTSYQQPNIGGSGERKEEVGEGGFSSAFGLMSLDDPAVLAGLTNDSAPFFSTMTGFPHPSSEGGSGAHSTNSSSTSLTSSRTSHSHQSSNTSHSSHIGLSLATPTPELLASLKGNLSAGAREALDSKEMRDLWKQYMRTPLTGPGSGGQGITSMFPLQTPTGPGQQLGGAAGRPSPTRRHSRVASLPSMKTPPIANQDFSAFGPGGDFASKGKERQQQHHDEGHEQERQAYSQAYSSVRTTLHGNAEDLKSYEQAVLARPAPTHLKLVPRRRGTMPAGTTAPSFHRFSPPQPPHIPSLSQATNMNAAGNNNNNDGGSHEVQRPGSSFTDAFGSAESPRESSVGTESSDGGASTTAFRPSFKRLASQTLGPANSKRALLGPAGWDDEDALEEEDELERDEAHFGQRRRYTVAGVGGEVGGLRRFSLPASAGGGIAGSGSTLPPIKTQGHQAELAYAQ